MTAHSAIRDFKDHVGQEVEVRGWLYSRRSKGKLHFLLIRDGSGIVQGVMVKGEVPDATFDEAGHLGQESSIIVTGVVREDARAPGGFELGLKSLRVLQDVKDYPIAHQEHGPDFLLSQRHLWLRSRKQAAVMRIRARIVKSIRDFFDNQGFTLLDAPIFTPNACEGTSTLFEVNYFDDAKAYLTQSGQLYGEAGAMALGKVYVFGPVFRAEKSKTRRHLTEFWMVEPEVAFATLEDVMDLAEGLISTIVADVLRDRRNDLAELERDISKLERIKAPFPRITYDEAAELLGKLGTGFVHGSDLGAADETALGDHFGMPVMVHRWPHEVKAFYMKRDPANDKLALGVDVIGPEGSGELVGGSQREDDLDVLRGRIQHHGLPEEPFNWYLDLRRYGSVPHAGFGLGLERTVSWICGREHVRECIPFPRMLYRIYP
jgi:asparaginyl-tRNA synthetase